MITHSFGGGTGSGFTARLLEIMADEYGEKTSKIRIQITDFYEIDFHRFYQSLFFLFSGTLVFIGSCISFSSL